MPVTDANPASASVASTGKGLRYIGNDLWAAFSGNVDPQNTTEVALDFLSPEQPIRADLTWMVDITELTANRNLSLEIKFNDLVILFWRAQLTIAGDFPDSFPFKIGPLGIMPQTRVVVTVGTNEDADVNQYITLLGQA